MHALADASINEIDVFDEKRGLAKGKLAKPKKKYIIEAHCTSFHCAGGSGMKARGKVVSVRPGTCACPACGHTLMWRRRYV
jgi:hypothetical protein